MGDLVPFGGRATTEQRVVRLCENPKGPDGNSQVRKGGLPPLERQRRDWLGISQRDISKNRKSILNGNTLRLERWGCNLKAEVASRAVGAQAGASHPS